MPGVSNYLQKLTKVKKGQPVCDVASSERINAIQDLLRALARGDHIMSGDNTRLRRGEGFVTISADAGGGSSFSSLSHPFTVTEHNNADGKPDGVNVSPGLVGTFIPKIGTVLLTDLTGTPPAPPVLAISGTCSVFLEVKLDMTDADHFENGITQVKVVSDQATLGNAEYDDVTGEVKELNIKWDGGDTGPRTTGYFYLKIADVQVITKPGDDTIITGFEIVQWLYDNIRTFICVGKKVVILV